MRTKWLSGLLVIGLVMLVPVQAAQAPAPVQRKLHISFSNGNVTLQAQGVTLRDILLEWQRVGNCQFPDINKISGGTLPPLQYVDQSEITVIRSLLGSMAGYLLFPRVEGTVGASRLMAVNITPVSQATTSFAGGGSPIAATLTTTQNDINDEVPPIQTVPNGDAPAQTPKSGATLPGNVGVPAPGVFVPVSPGRVGGPPTTPPPGTTGRGGGGR